jgi:hypothetical protein
LGKMLSLEWGLKNLRDLKIMTLHSAGAELEYGMIISMLSATECCWIDLYYLSDDIANRVLSIRRWGAFWR